MEWRLNHVGQMAQSVQDYSQCNQIIILTDCNEVPEEVKVLAKYKDLEIEIITDRDLDKGDFKLIEVK